MDLSFDPSHWRSQRLANIAITSTESCLLPLTNNAYYEITFFGVFNKERDNYDKGRIKPRSQSYIIRVWHK